MPHIHTDPGQLDITATGYIVRVDTAEPLALVHMHRKHHKLLPVGGHVELTETPWQAMAHELQEESGYSIDELGVLQPVARLQSLTNVIFHPYPISMNTHVITPEHHHSDIEYAFIAMSEPRAAVGSGESADLRWLSQAELNGLDESQLYSNTKEVYNFIFDTALHSWDSVPAAKFAK